MSEEVQVVVIHGGDSFDSYEDYLYALRLWPVTIDTFRPHTDWKSTLQSKLGEGYDVILPKMPCRDNAKYGEWQIWFERLLPLLNKNIMLIGHSLGGIFLAKYLAENHISNTITELILVAAPHNNTPDCGDFRLPSSLDLLKTQTQHITLIHSKDDPVVPFTEFEAYRAQLPQSKELIFTDRGHFNEPSFPELIEHLRFHS